MASTTPDPYEPPEIEERSPVAEPLIGLRSGPPPP